MTPFLFTLATTFFISLLSLSGSFILFLKDHILRHISLVLVALAAGALLGTAFLHLLPEVIEGGEFPEQGFLILLAGFVLFYVAEKLLHLHHGTEGGREHHPRELGVLSLTGYFVHNFVDGVILAAAFLIDVKLGLVAAAAVALHEVPQEVAEFGVLLYAGFSKVKALFLNFLSATSVILGGIVGFLAQDFVSGFVPFILLFAAGTFLYIGASDFIPEIKRERHPGKTFILFAAFAGGLVLMWLLTFVE